jgi:hypothetical protein
VQVERADLYRAFGLERNPVDLLISKVKWRFSATGGGKTIKEIAAKCGDLCAVSSYLSDSNDLMAERDGFE